MGIVTSRHVDALPPAASSASATAALRLRNGFQPRGDTRTTARSRYSSDSKRRVESFQYAARSNDFGRLKRSPVSRSSITFDSRYVRGALPGTAAAMYQVPAFSTSPSGSSVRSAMPFQLS